MQFMALDLMKFVASVPNGYPMFDLKKSMVSAATFSGVPWGDLSRTARKTKNVWTPSSDH